SGVVGTDHANAHRAINLARAKLERIGGNLSARGTLAATEAQILLDDDRLGEAEAAMREAVGALEQAYGADHPKLGPALAPFSQIRQAEGKPQDALATAERTRTILANALGEDHPTVAGADMTVAQSLILLKRYPEARERLVRADAVITRVFG